MADADRFPPVRKAAVLGASGFWGSWLVDLLIQQGVHVTGISRHEQPALAELAKPHDSIVVNLETADPLTYLSEDLDVVYFLAGSASVPYSVKDPIGDLEANVRSPVRVLQSLRALPSPPRFVYASSAAVYGSSLYQPMDEKHPTQPLSPYGVSKLVAEKYVRLYATQFGVPGVSVRPFSLYGPGQAKQVVYDLARRLTREESPIRMLGSADVSRDFIFVADAAKALWLITNRAQMSGEAFNLGSGRETPLGELAKMLSSIAGSNAPIEFSGEVREGDPLHWCGDITALRTIGYESSTSLYEGLRSTFHWVSSAVK